MLRWSDEPLEVFAGRRAIRRRRVCRRRRRRGWRRAAPSLLVPDLRAAPARAAALGGLRARRSGLLGRACTPRGLAPPERHRGATERRARFVTAPEAVVRQVRPLGAVEDDTRPTIVRTPAVAPRMLDETSPTALASLAMCPECRRCFDSSACAPPSSAGRCHDLGGHRTARAGHPWLPGHGDPPCGHPARPSRRDRRRTHAGRRHVRHGSMRPAGAREVASCAWRRWTSSVNRSVVLLGRSGEPLIVDDIDHMITESISIRGCRGHLGGAIDQVVQAHRDGVLPLGATCQASWTRWTRWPTRCVPRRRSVICTESLWCDWTVARRDGRRSSGIRSARSARGLV